MIRHLTGMAVAFAVLTLLFWGVEFCWPSASNQRKWRRGSLTDVACWFFTPFISKPLTQLIALVSSRATDGAVSSRKDPATSQPRTHEQRTTTNQIK